MNIHRKGATMGRHKESVDGCDRDCFHCQLPDCLKSGNFRDANGLGPPVGLNSTLYNNQSRKIETEDSIRSKYVFDIGQRVKVLCQGRACDEDKDRPDGRTAMGWRNGVVVGVYPHHVRICIKTDPSAFTKETRKYHTSISYAEMASSHCLEAI